MNDFQLAARTLRKSPGFTVVAVLTLALGIGANTAVFSLVHAVLLKSLPFHDPARLVAVWDSYAPQIAKAGVSPTEYAEWQRQTDLLAQVAWYSYVPTNLVLTRADGPAIEAQVTLVSPDFLPLLGANPAIGRALMPNDPPHTALISDRIWRTVFAGDPAISGKSIRMDGEQYSVAGVMPRDFAFPKWADVWLPNGPLLRDGLTNPVRHQLGVVARMREGVTSGAITQRSVEIARRLAAGNAKTSTGWSMHAAGLQDDLTASVRPALLMLLGAVTLVLLIACANVANLFLSRAISRSKEIALRTALGAGVWRLMRQLLAESLTLSLTGAGVGLLLAEICLQRFSPIPSPLDSTVLWFLIAISFATAIFFGLIPAAQILRSSPVAVIKSNSVAAGGSQRLRAALVVAEFSLALILAAGAGILVKSFAHLMHVNPGFDPDGVLTLRLSTPATLPVAPLFQRIQNQVRSLPGVQAVAATNMLPAASNRAVISRFLVPESPLSHPDAPPAAQILRATPQLFHALGIPIRSGRAFTAADAADNTVPVIVNETMARRFWPGRDPVGQKFITALWGPTPGYSRIVGVAGDVKRYGLDSESTYDIYFPVLGDTFLVIRGSGNIGALAPSVTAIVRNLAPDVPVSDVKTMNLVVSESARDREWTMALLAAFAGLALTLSLIGIYGVMAWIVGQRTREIGIRMALGANAAQVRAMVVGYSLKLSAVGLAIGLAGAFVLRRVLATLVFDVSPSDPAIYVAVAALLLAAALMASYIPARRASRVDPSIALRWE